MGLANGTNLDFCCLFPWVGWFYPLFVGGRPANHWLLRVLSLGKIKFTRWLQTACLTISLGVLFCLSGLLACLNLSLRTIQRMSNSETGFGGNDLRRLEAGLSSCLRIVHCGLQKSFIALKPLAVMHTVVCLWLVHGWENEGFLENTVDVPVVTMNWERVKDYILVIMQLTFCKKRRRKVYQ